MSAIKLSFVSDVSQSVADSAHQAINLSTKSSSVNCNQQQQQVSSSVSESFLIRNILNLSSSSSTELEKNSIEQQQQQRTNSKQAQAKIIKQNERRKKTHTCAQKQSKCAQTVDSRMIIVDVDDDEKSSTLKRNKRTMFSQWQLSSLEWRFSRNKYLTTLDRKRLAKVLTLNQLQVKTWFQNRRMKWKKQILATGCQKSPTKPKGRPRRDSIPPIDD